MPPWYLQNSKNWVIFSYVEKNCQKKKKIKTRSSPPWGTHKNSEKNQILCTGIHGFEEKSKFHVPGYMIFCFFFKSMYPSTWNFDFFFKSMYPGTWNLIFFHYSYAYLMGGRTGFLFYFSFGNFFRHVKKLLNFLNFVNIKVSKFKLNHLGFFCKLYFLIGQSEKSGIEI